MMTVTTPDADQLAMFVLPHIDAEPKAVATRRRPAAKATTETAPLDPVTVDVTTPLGSLASLFQVIPDTTPGVVLVDPRAIVVDPVNVHHRVPFDPEAHGELITGMMASGNTVPIRLRPDPAGGPGFSCVSGARRLGAALHIQAAQPGFRLRAIVEEMSDAQAVAIAEGDNAGRSGVSALRQAQKWAEHIERFYDNDRGAFMKATGIGSSVLSRTLALLSLPQYVLDCCRDIYALTPYFAEQLVPRLSDPSEEPTVRERAEALIAAGRRLPPAQLATALLKPPAKEATPGEALWASADGRGALSLRPGRKGDKLELTGIQALTASERRALLKALDAHLRAASR